MTVHCNYFAQIRRAAGVEAESFAVASDASVFVVLRQAAARHDAAFADTLFTAAGPIHSTIIVLVNGVPAQADAVVNEGDTISLLSPVAGG